MRRQPIIVTLALCCSALAVARDAAASPQLDHVVDALRELRAARSRPAKIASTLQTPLAPGPLAGGLVATPPPSAADGRLQVYVDCTTLGSPQLAALEQAGLVIERANMERRLVQGRVDPAALDALAGFDWVRGVRSIDRAVVRAGSVTSEGDGAARADLLRAEGLDGSGVVVGVISDGIDGLADAQASGDLPAVQVPRGCRRGGGDEGTALLEIVHDVAPGATLLFSGPASSVDMLDAVECLTDAGADVIVDDLGFFGEPYFEDGPVAQAVAAAVASGVSYHSSAGNQAEEHVEQDFVAIAGTTAHDFAGGAGDPFDDFVVPAGGTVTCILQWNDPFGASSNDYDLAVLDQDANVVDFSFNPQTGTEDPIELVEIANQTAADQRASVVVSRFAGEARRLEVFCLGAARLEHGTPDGSIVGHPALASVVAVGAIDALDPGLDDVEAFSSRGPARIDFPVAESRAKPDVAAFDGVAISNAGGFPACPPFCAFFGTSAASPHSAGVAALLLEKDGELTPAEVQAALTAGAVDIGAPGFDAASGFGRLDAVAAAEEVEVPACASNDECDDGDACTADVCDPALGCVSSPPAGAGGLACLLARLGAPDVCGPDDLDAKTASIIARRSAAAEALLAKAGETSRPAARAILLRKIGRKLQSIVKRLGKADVPIACAEIVERLVGDARSLADTEELK